MVKSLEIHDSVFCKLKLDENSSDAECFEIYLILLKAPWVKFLKTFLKNLLKAFLRKLLKATPRKLSIL